jgi:phosphate starvation-inducible PhoH-like protein
MKMFLTRMGFDSKVVVVGDVTQSDLPGPESNGLAEADRILSKVPEIKFIHLTSEDTVRHELVQKIIEAYAHSNGNGNNQKH